MQRRDFLKLVGLAPVGLAFPPPLRAGEDCGRWSRVLVLVELAGGNDGLNTVVPYADPAYRRLRPNLGVGRDRVMPLSEAVGFNDALTALRPSWDGGELAVVLGVGYPEPNRSHFRSIEIWETGSDADDYLDEGWVASVFETCHPPQDFAADGVVIGRGYDGPLAGPGMRNISLRTPEEFVKQSGRAQLTEAETENPSLQHILRVQRDIQLAAASLSSRLDSAPSLDVEFPRSRVGRELETAGRLLAAGIPVAVIKVTHGGFDTHANQRGQHDRLLRELAEGLAAFRTAVMGLDRWSDTLVMTYSEFGRRAAENGSSGTDHGTAAPHFLMGGRVVGGLYGRQPALDRLVDGDLVHAVDFRSLYATVGQRFWGVSGADSLNGVRYPPLDCLL